MPTTFSLPSELTIYTLAELHPQWLAWLSQTGRPGADEPIPDESFRVSAEAVGEVDAAGVQWLLSLSNALTLRQRTLQLVNPSQPLSNACAALGLSAMLANADVTEATQ